MIRNYDGNFPAKTVADGTQTMQNDKVTLINATKREKILIHVLPQYDQDQKKQ